MRFPVIQDYDYRRSQYKYPHLPDHPQSIPWALAEAHKEQIMANHSGQTLDQLADRGGLSVMELVAAIEGDNPFRPRGEVAWTMLGAINLLNEKARPFES